MWYTRRRAAPFGVSPQNLLSGGSLAMIVCSRTTAAHARSLGQEMVRVVMGDGRRAMGADGEGDG